MKSESSESPVGGWPAIEGGTGLSTSLVEAITMALQRRVDLFSKSVLLPRAEYHELLRDW